MSTPDTTNEQLRRALMKARDELERHAKDFDYDTDTSLLEMIRHACRLPLPSQIGFAPDAPPPSRVVLFGNGWSEGLPIRKVEREGDALHVFVDPQIERPAACDPSVGMTKAGVQQLAALSVDDLLARYRDGQLDAQAVAALAHKARGAEQLQAQLQLYVPTATGQSERRRRDVAQNHVNASAASVVAELGAACCCGLHLPGRVVRAVRDLAWRLATLKAVRK